jgi:hypothetical protein
LSDSRIKIQYMHPQPPKVYKINFKCERFSYPNSKYMVSSVYHKYTCEEGVPVTTPSNNYILSSAFSLGSGNHHVQVCSRSCSRSSSRYFNFTPRQQQPHSSRQEFALAKMARSHLHCYMCLPLCVCYYYLIYFVFATII